MDQEQQLQQHVQYSNSTLTVLGWGGTLGHRQGQEAHGQAVAMTMTNQYQVGHVNNLVGPAGDVATPSGILGQWNGHVHGQYGVDGLFDTDIYNHNTPAPGLGMIPIPAAAAPAPGPGSSEYDGSFGTGMGQGRPDPGPHAVALPDTNSNVHGHSHRQRHAEIYSRKVFIGGLPQDISIQEIYNTFRPFGHLIVTWPHRELNPRAIHPPKGFAFLLYRTERAVRSLIHACQNFGGKTFYTVESPTIPRGKLAQVRVWNLKDQMAMGSPSHDGPNKFVFVGGIPRSVKAVEILDFFNQLFGGVVYVLLYVDHEFKYPKGSAMLLFDNSNCQLAALSQHTVTFTSEDGGGTGKILEIKPFIVPGQPCDFLYRLEINHNNHVNLCQNCLQYFCDQCWNGCEYVHGSPPSYAPHIAVERNGNIS